MADNNAAFEPDPSWPSILDLARRLWGEPTAWRQNKNEARFGKRQSKSVLLRERVWKDHEADEGGGYIELHIKAIGPLPPKPNGHGADLPPWENIGTVYRYLDATGALVFEVIRTISGNPRFHMRRPDATVLSGWRWSIRDIPPELRPLYRLPDLVHSLDMPVWLCEGEKDVDRLAELGFIATTNANGAKNWRPEHARALAGRNVIVLPDNDDAGRQRAAAVAASLHGLAASVRVLVLPGLPPKGDVSDWLDSGGTAEELDALADHAPEYAPQQPPKPNGDLVLRPARLPDPTTIPPREWLYSNDLIRGYVSVLVAPGGTGKSAWALAIGISLAARRAFLGGHIFSNVNVAVINLDDPMDELERRVAAIQLAHNIPNNQLDGRLFLEDCDNHGGLTLAAPAQGDNGFYVANPDEPALTALIKANNIGLIVCDPFAESHTLEENSNPQMIQAAAVWRRIARATNCAVLLVHHVRKGEIAGIDSARGAKALTDSARIGLLMSVMSAAEAELFGIHEDERQGYIRLDDAKRNMAPAGKARWFQHRSIPLDNTFNPTYPCGDHVGAIVAWQPPDDAIAKAPATEINAVLDAIEAGPEPGIRYTKTKRGDSGRWCGQLLCDAFQCHEKEAAKMISAWFRSGLLFEVDYKHPRWRRPNKGVAVRAHNRPT